MSDRTPEQRKADRASRMWARVVPLGAEPKGDLLRHSSAAQRLALVDEITREVWMLGRRPMPDYARRDAPIRIVPLNGHQNTPR